jgi:hypothetical protein
MRTLIMYLRSDFFYELTYVPGFVLFILSLFGSIKRTLFFGFKKAKECLQSGKSDG